MEEQLDKELKLTVQNVTQEVIVLKLELKHLQVNVMQAFSALEAPFRHGQLMESWAQSAQKVDIARLAPQNKRDVKEASIIPIEVAKLSLTANFVLQVDTAEEKLKAHQPVFVPQDIIA